MADKIVFKERALVRSGDILYYGDTENNYILRLKVLEGINLGNVKLATKVLAELLYIKDKNNIKIVKTTERSGLYEALEIGEIWISRMIAEGK